MEITKQEWNTHASAQEHAEFLQSYEWGEFQHALNRRVLRITTPQIFFSAIRMSLPFGLSYIYIPRGPVLTQENVSAWNAAVQEIAKKECAVFVRFEPVGEYVGMTGFNVKETLPIQPKTTWIVDISKTEPELLTDMHAKTRYNIRLAERKGISVSCAATQEEKVYAGEVFLRLAAKTSQRHEFRLHPQEYYRTMVRILGEGERHVIPSETRNPDDTNIKLYIFTAQYQEKDIAAALVIRFGDTATYVHGGSDEDYKEVMAPHALHWKIMQDMKAKGARWYDMGGIDLSGDPQHPWAGITRFKQGFGGYIRNYPGAYDLIFKKGHYTLYKWLRMVRRM